jgi:plastocyanin
MLDCPAVPHHSAAPGGGRPRRGSPFLFACLAAAAPAAAGTVSGRVELIDKGGRRAADLEGVIVYVDGPKARGRPERVTMAMKDKAFRPRVAAVSAGGVVDFPNEDPIFHNVFSVSGANRFDLDLYKRPRSGSWTFSAPGVARVYCNIHPQMSAVVLVRDNPYFTTAAADGSFTIEHVPAGRWQLKAWQERAPEVSQEIVVATDSRVTAQLVLDASRWKRVPHKNKYGKDYKTDERY